MPLPFIAVVRGGYTGESVISLQSARTMLEALDAQRFHPVYVSVSRDAWVCETAEGRALPFDRGTFTADRGNGMERFAGALIATVVGLFVAIPAMFAYNYMITTIRAITQELDNFTAEYATAIEHGYVDNRSVAEEVVGALQQIFPERAERFEVMESRV